MGIIIQNISKVYRKRGRQRYVLRINDKVIAYFYHKYEDGVTACLRKAALAAENLNREEVKLDQFLLKFCMEAGKKKK